MKIVVGSDHAGFPMKAELLAFLKERGHEVEDVGSYDPKPVDFPDIARKVAVAITSHLVEAHRAVFLSLVRRDPDAAESRLREHFKIGDELRRKNLFTNYQSPASTP